MGAMGRDQPDGEHLADVDVQDEVGLIESCSHRSNERLSLANPSRRKGGGLLLTNTIDLEVDPRAHDFVPSEDVVDQLAAVVEATGSAEGVGEGGILAEVLVDGFGLLLGWRLGETMDDVADFLNWVIHGEAPVYVDMWMCARSRYVPGQLL
jgi:hypothetical protein